MQVAILSGKGGAGKTLLAVNLINLMNGSVFLDCDVEEPNGVFYFSDHFVQEPIYNLVPKVNDDLCIHCHQCLDACQYNALIDFLGKVKVMPNLCHSCGACHLVCPSKAISERDELIGWINHAQVDQHHIYGGQLKIGKETGVKIIESLLEKVDSTVDSVIDCPPGNGCSVMESIDQADLCVLVAEPTVFGLDNLRMVYELTKVFNKKSAIVINKVDHNDKMIENFASEYQIPIIGKIPFNKELALANSNLEIVSQSKFHPLFQDILHEIRKQVK